MRRVLIALLLFVTFLLSIVSYEYEEESQTSQLILKSYDEFDKREQKEIDCLALNIYREAGVEKDDGKLAVALVTMNRVKAPGFPETVCKVVQQKRNNTCQFSWKCLNRLPNIDQQIYNYSRNIAIMVFLNHHMIDDITQGALFYHADYVRPRWKKLEVTTKIGRHIFYKPLGEA
jgi:spore germination cell wall hydrolase CwlJ-like protein